MVKTKWLWWEIVAIVISGGISIGLTVAAGVALVYGIIGRF